MLLFILPFVPVKIILIIKLLCIITEEQTFDFINVWKQRLL